MKLSQFEFNLPQELIAQYPTEVRDESRLLVLDSKTGEIEHRIFKDLINYFGKDDVFVFNNTKVFPARLYGSKEKTNAVIDVFLLRELDPATFLWDVLVEPARKIRIGNKLFFGEANTLVAEVIDNTTSRGRTLRFLYEGDHADFKRELFSMGQTPLPFYIDRKPEPEDVERYQTIYATEEGAVVAPAAGFHFSRELRKRLQIQDCEFAYLTVHTGLAAYRDIDVDDLSKYKMGSESISVTQECCDIVNRSIDKSGRICAVGTSVLKAIEASISTDGYIKEFRGWDNQFIFPPYDFRSKASLITNFHMPKSSLLMMVAALGGYKNVMHAYEVAIQEKYRFGAYGDAMLVL